MEINHPKYPDLKYTVQTNLEEITRKNAPREGESWPEWKTRMLEVADSYSSRADGVKGVDIFLATEYRATAHGIREAMDEMTRARKNLQESGVELKWPD